MIGVVGCAVRTIYTKIFIPSFLKRGRGDYI